MVPPHDSSSLMTFPYDVVLTRLSRRCVLVALENYPKDHRGHAGTRGGTEVWPPV